MNKQGCGSQTINFGSGSGSYLEGHFGSGSCPSFQIRIRIGILVCEIFVKFSNLKSECTFKGHFCAEIELFMLKIVFISLHLFFKKPDPQWWFRIGIRILLISLFRIAIRIQILEGKSFGSLRIRIWLRIRLRIRNTAANTFRSDRIRIRHTAFLVSTLDTPSFWWFAKEHSYCYRVKNSDPTQQ